MTKKVVGVFVRFRAPLHNPYPLDYRQTLRFLGAGTLSNTVVQLLVNANLSTFHALNHYFHIFFPLV